MHRLPKKYICEFQEIFDKGEDWFISKYLFNKFKHVPKSIYIQIKVSNIVWGTKQYDTVPAYEQEIKGVNMKDQIDYRYDDLVQALKEQYTEMANKFSKELEQMKGNK